MLSHPQKQYMKSFNDAMKYQKSVFEQKISYLMSINVIEKLRVNAFPLPNPEILDSFRNCSTLSDSIANDENEAIIVTSIPTSTPATTQTTTITTTTVGGVGVVPVKGDVVTELSSKLIKRREIILKGIRQFEDICLLEGSLHKSTIEEFSRKTNQFATLLFSANTDSIHYQNTESVLMALLLRSAESLKLSIKYFLSVLSRVSPKATKVSLIRRTKCYALFKTMLK